MNTPLIRYGKKKGVLHKIDFTKYFPYSCLSHQNYYIEPFCGTGIVGLNYLRHLDRIHVVLNDKNKYLVKFFEYLHREPEKLKDAFRFRFPGCEEEIVVDDELDEIVKWYYTCIQEMIRFDRGNFFHQGFFERIDEMYDVLHRHNVILKDYDIFKVFDLIDSSVWKRRGTVATVAYFDPPYPGTHWEKYECGMLDFDRFYRRLEELGEDETNWFFLSINENEYNQILVDAGWDRKILWNLNKNKISKKRKEILYSNHPILNRRDGIHKYF
jgi:site-specific DNA-adenine methylase